jgi:hypothetical protein
MKKSYWQVKVKFKRKKKAGGPFSIASVSPPSRSGVIVLSLPPTTSVLSIAYTHSDTSTCQFPQGTMSTKARSLARKTLFLSLRERACAGLSQCSAASTKSLGRPISLLSGPIQAANKRKQTVFPQYQRCAYLGNYSPNPESCYSSERTQLTNHKKRSRDVSTKECPRQDNLDEHQHQPPAIDNSGIIEEGEEEHRPPTVAVKGSQMKGGNVVWRASRHQLAACHAAVEEQMSANEKSHTAATENKSLHSHAQFKSLGVIEPVRFLKILRCRRTGGGGACLGKGLLPCTVV